MCSYSGQKSNQIYQKCVCVCVCCIQKKQSNSGTECISPQVPKMNSEQPPCALDCAHTVSDMGAQVFLHAPKIKETEDSYVIEASTLQFDLLPVNVPGIAIARLEKIGFSG